MFCLSGTFRLCQTAKSEMSVYERKDILCELQGALLQTGEKGTDPGGHAFFRTEDAAASSGAGGVASGVSYKRKIKKKRVNRLSNHATR